MRSTAADAQLALLLEVTGTPKPGNVDRRREYADLRFEHFVAGAVGARPGLSALADADEPLGSAFETAVEGMARQTGGNTQFGAVLLLAPLVRAAATDDLEPATDDLEPATDDLELAADHLGPGAPSAVVANTTVEDTVAFYRAFEHVDVAVEDPPAGMEPLDVRRGGDAAPAIRERDIAWRELMAESADHDGVAAEWTDGFPRTFEAARAILDDTGPVADRASRAHLELLASDIDTFVATQHDQETATEVRERAAAAIEGREDPDALADELVERGINPGTTADVVAGALFVALERGLEV